MKAIAIVALIFAALSIFIPVGGIFLAMLCSLMALIAFRSQITLSGITFGLNIINTAFLTPSLVRLIDPDLKTWSPEFGETYFFAVGFHVVLLFISIVWRLIRGPHKEPEERIV